VSLLAGVRTEEALAIAGQGVRLPVTSEDIPPCGQNQRRSRKAARADSCGLN